MYKNPVISIDFGTQSVRVSIINNKGEFLAFEKVTYDKPYFSIKPGYCEQDPEYYYSCMCKASQALVEKNKDLVAKCEYFSITCFRDTAAYLDENYKVVRPSIIWLDQRQAKLEEKLPFLYRLIFGIIGMTDTVVFNRKRTPAHWLKENEKENWNKIRYYSPLSSYFNYRLTGVLGDGSSNMIGHYPINFKKGEWYKSDKHIKGCMFGIPLKKLPKIFKTGEVVGTISPIGHMESGLPVGLKFIATGNDKSCEALGSGAINSDYAHISYGTASSIAVTSKKYFEPEKFLPAYTCCYKDWFTGETQVYRGYWMLNWFTKEFAKSESIEATIERIAPEEVLNKKLSEIPPGSDGLILQPYWGPSLSKPLAKGAIIGFFDVHTKYHIYRAIIEGIAYELKSGLIGIQKKLHKKVKYLTISGGGSKSDAICQITSDIFNLPVIKTNTYETSSLGCAMAQYLALGTYNSLEEVKANMIKENKIFTPNKEASKKYDYLFNKIYVDIYPRLKKDYKKLTEYLQQNNEGIIK